VYLPVELNCVQVHNFILSEKILATMLHMPVRNVISPEMSCFARKKRALSSLYWLLAISVLLERIMSNEEKIWVELIDSAYFLIGYPK
jgi:hypothetical protein